MKLLALRFKNLNSLEGEWLIDFTHPEYEQNGIFAISGPTGAGKTTLLDAICLALFGCTPRLETISQSQNEIISKQHAECFAELEFQTASGTYNAHWSQRKAHNRPDGKLQPVKRELFDMISGKLLSSRINEVSQLITQISGLDFQRFTRTVLLAQGRFADFLNAKEEERSPILEQITGTEIYSDISIKVHQIKNEEEKKLTELAIGVNSISLLKTDEVDALQNSLANLEQQLSHVNEQQKHAAAGIKWWEESLQNQRSQQNLNDQLAQCLQAEQDFSPQAHTLALANKTLPLIKTHTEINGLRDSLKHNQQSLTKLSPQLDDIAHARELREKQLIEIRHQKSSTAQFLEEQRVTFNKVRELDSLIAQEKKLLDEEQARLALIATRLNNSTTELENHHTHYEQITTLIKQLCQRILEQGYSLGDLNLSSLAQCSTAEAIEKLFILLKDNTEITKLNHLIDGLKDDLRNLEAIRDETQRYYDKNAKLGKHRASIKQFYDEINQRIAQRTRLEQEHKLHEAKVAQHEAEYKLAVTIKSLEEHRHDLADGSPCPLCGALEHPLIKGELSVPKISERDLEESKKTERAVLMMLNDNARQIAHLDAGAKAVEQQLSEDAADLAKLLSNIEVKHELLINTFGSSLAIQNTADLKNALNQQQISPAAFKTQIQRLQEQIKRHEKELTVRNNALHWSNNTSTTFERVKVNIAYLSEQIKAYEADTKALQESKSNKQHALNVSRDTRQALFGDKDPNKAEEQLRLELKRIEAQLDEKSTEQQEADAIFIRLKQQIKSLQEAIETLKERLHLLEPQFNKQLEKQQFDNEESFLAACMNEEQRLHLDQQQRLLAERKSTLKEQLQQVEANLQFLAEQQPEQHKALNIYRLEHESLEAQKAKLNAVKGRDQERLSMHLDAVSRVAEQNKLIEAQEKETNRWRMLHELIGSADGKKYRNFAQNLTFELVLHYANLQLNQMSDRYSLCIDNRLDSKLELTVEDHYQGDEIRSIKNLSGGESFIVSLALALGLSQMVSGSMQLQSLFLDEGFGTLDEDSLDIALSSLSNLQQSGKTIGIISHVAALKERISTQIQVIPMSGGRSRLEGPGVKPA
ncbi:Nuclease sbcCD subunit C [Oligella ureolytica]|uniref:AAA family ATPase n=1 Tax=Oligella ureolytica TaxID=90244 RepID=A0A378XJI5_9BURK|nr:AAA family ATPase [Oligella ureolytica]QPT39557.1 AAA family ATPase [Oligella ureolytica]SUA52895.1 Nuclease sbcCD subunit C [Oligella ureolytica]SUA56673.1 Nuclease sbcCD subunit C [Oligella ureolytica]